MNKAQSKTDVNFLLTLTEAKATDAANFIIDRLNSIIYAIGAKGEPDVNALSEALSKCQTILESITDLKEQRNTIGEDTPELIEKAKEINEQFSEIEENIINKQVSKSYAFYIEDERNNISDIDKRVETLKTLNLEQMKRAYNLENTAEVQAFLESCIKINKSLSLLPFAKNGPDKPQILDKIEQMIGINDKTLDQIAFRQSRKDIQDDTLAQNQNEDSQPKEMGE